MAHLTSYFGASAITLRAAGAASRCFASSLEAQCAAGGGAAVLYRWFTADAATGARAALVLSLSLALSLSRSLSLFLSLPLSLSDSMSGSL